MKNYILAREAQSEFQERIKDMFDKLTKNGFFARQDFWCCQSCGWADIPDNEENVVFYHAQDTEDIPTGRIHLAWQGNSDSILEAAKTAGLDVEWNGEENTRIVVKLPVKSES